MPQARVRRALYAVPALWLLLLVRESPVPNESFYKSGYQIQPSAVRFESGEHMYGYRIQKKDDSVLILLHSFPWLSDHKGLGYSVHLVDQVSGDSVASLDALLNRDHTFRLFSSAFVRVYVQEIELAIPPQAPANRALWVVLTLWRKERGAFESSSGAQQRPANAE